MKYAKLNIFRVHKPKMIVKMKGREYITKFISQINLNIKERKELQNLSTIFELNKKL